MSLPTPATDNNDTVGTKGKKINRNVLAMRYIAKGDHGALTVIGYMGYYQRVNTLNDEARPSQ